MHSSTVDRHRDESNRRNSPDDLFHRSRSGLQLRTDSRGVESRILQFQRRRQSPWSARFLREKQVVALPGAGVHGRCRVVHVDHPMRHGRTIGIDGASLLVHRLRHAARVDAPIDPLQHRPSVVLVGLRRFDSVADPGPLVVQRFGDFSKAGGETARVGVERNLLDRGAVTIGIGL